MGKHTTFPIAKKEAEIEVLVSLIPEKLADTCEVTVIRYRDLAHAARLRATHTNQSHQQA